MYNFSVFKKKKKRNLYQPQSWLLYRVLMLLRAPIQHLKRYVMSSDSAEWFMRPGVSDCDIFEELHFVGIIAVWCINLPFQHGNQLVDLLQRHLCLISLFANSETRNRLISFFSLVRRAGELYSRFTISSASCKLW